MNKELTPLEALDKIGKTLLRDYKGILGANGYALFSEEIDVLKTAIIRLEELENILKGFTNIEKKLKAFEVIKEKGVAVGMLQLECVGLQKYNDFIGDKKLYLTQEEYDLLKEVLL